jgi:glycine/D-amino acid oxidase-like deaminating enzyme/nitrite reductase/ring-hydroxylating ferredoxin subunit
MNTPSEQSMSLWMRTAPAPGFPALDQDVRTGVCIVGAGIAGLSTAYRLARKRQSVVVLDDGPVGGGQTRRTTAHLSNAIDDRYVEIERIHGEEGAKLAAASHTVAIDRIEAIVQEEGIGCDFTRLDGYLFCSPDEKPDLLERERDAARRAGLNAVDVAPRAPIAEFDTGPALRFPSQATIDPMKYLGGLVRAVRRYRGQIFCDTHVTQIEGGTPARVSTQAGPAVVCDAVVVATNTPVIDATALHTKQAPYLTYVVALPVPRGAVTPALYWDTADPYHYIRLQRGDGPEDLLIVGGEDHKTGQDEDDAVARYARLELWARRRWPECGPAAYRWSGQVMETIDGLAYIGRHPRGADNVFIATGDSGMGMTHGTIAGTLLSDLIRGKDNPWEELYDPSRKRVWGGAGKEYVKENLNVAKQYLKSWVAGGDVKSDEEIARGGGAVVRRGLRKVAVYRDDAGRLHECSATCPHLGCVVHWNAGEKTWDCPCHGSRFDAYGHVINGPANVDLTPVGGRGVAPAGRRGAGEQTTAGRREREPSDRP